MAVEIPKTSQKSVSQSDATPADIEEFRRGTLTPDMSGDEFVNMGAARYDPDARGFTATQPAYPADPMPELPHTAEQPAYQEPQAPGAEPDFKQKYGEALNAMGEWRRMAERNQALIEQLAEVNNRLSSAPPPQPGYAPPQPPGPPARIYPDKGLGELMTVGEYEDSLRNDILPEIYNRATVAMQQAADMAAARAQRMLPAWDVQPAEEGRAIQSLRSEFQNFDQRFTATEKNGLIQGRVAALRAQNGANGNQYGTRPTATAVGRVAGAGGAPAAAPRIIDPNQVVRQQTFIESAPPTQMSAEPTASSDPRVAFARDLQALDAEALAKTGRKATAIQVKTLLSRYGIGEVNDWQGGTVSR
jgi:hypothetical protein